MIVSQLRSSRILLLAALIVGISASVTAAQKVGVLVDQLGVGVGDLKSGQTELGDKLDVVISALDANQNTSHTCYCLIGSACMLLGRDMRLYRNTTPEADVHFPLMPGHFVQYYVGAVPNELSLQGLPSTNFVSTTTLRGYSSLGIRIQPKDQREVTVRFIAGAGHECLLYTPHSTGVNFGTADLLVPPFSAMPNYNSPETPVTHYVPATTAAPMTPSP